MSGGILRTAIVATVALITVSACSTTVSGEPGADPSSAPKLDTGNLSVAATAPVARTPADAWLQESWRIADGVVEPWSVDSALTRKVPGELSPPLVSPVQIGADGGDKILRGGAAQVFTLPQIRAMAATPFLGGFIALAGDSDSPSRILAVGMLRFADAATATRAVDGLTPKLTSLPPGFPTVAGSRVLESDSAPDKQSFAAIAQRGDLVLIAHARAGAKEVATELVGKALASQVSKASAYSPTPYTGIPPLDVPMDREGIVARTLPSSGGDEAALSLGLSKNNSPYYGYFTPYAKALALVGGRESWTRDVTKYGLELETMTGSSSVQRMHDPVSARQKLFDKYPEPSVNGRIPGLATDVARCGKVESSTKFACGVRFGRYFAETLHPTLAHAKQATAAQYLILKSAG